MINPWPISSIHERVLLVKFMALPCRDGDKSNQERHETHLNEHANINFIPQTYTEGQQKFREDHEFAGGSSGVVFFVVRRPNFVTIYFLHDLIGYEKAKNDFHSVMVFIQSKKKFISAPKRRRA